MAVRQVLFVTASALALAGPAGALDRCVAGQRVVLPDAAPGIVTAVDGDRCRVEREDGRAPEQWSAAALAPVRPADVPADLAPAPGIETGSGSYNCPYLAETAPVFEFGDVITIDPMTPGPLRPDVEIESRGSSFYMTCSPAR